MRDLDNNIHTMDVIPTEDLDNTLTISEGIPTEEMRGNFDFCFFRKWVEVQVFYPLHNPFIIKHIQCCGCFILFNILTKKTEPVAFFISSPTQTAIIY